MTCSSERWRAARPSDAERLREFRGRTGIVGRAGPVLAPLAQPEDAAAADGAAHRGRHRDRRAAAARIPPVEVVRYPGFGGLLSFDVADGTAAHKVETSLERIKNATSLGGVESVLESRSRWEGDRVPAGLLRLSVGLEDPDELWADLEQALAR